MFFFDDRKPCCFRGKYLYPRFVECRGRHTLLPASWTGPEASRDTAGVAGHLFDHQAPLTRPSEAFRAACSSFAISKAKLMRSGSPGSRS